MLMNQSIIEISILSMFLVVSSSGFILQCATPAWSQPNLSFSDIYEPSDAIQIFDGSVLIVEDEGDHPLQLFSIASEKGELLLSPKAITGDKIKAHDLEGITEGGKGDVFLITSHSATKKDKRSKTREQLLKVEIRGQQISNLQVFDDLLPYIQKQLHESLNLSKKDIEDINIEGIAFNYLKETLLIGLRTPLFQDRALMLSLLNPYDLFSKKQKPKFDLKIISLDLEGGGIRAIAYDKIHDQYFFAGESQNKKGKLRSRVWVWDSKMNNKPTRVEWPKMKGLKNIEGIAIVQYEGLPYLLFVCDDGDRKQGQGGSYGLINTKELSYKE